MIRYIFILLLLVSCKGGADKRDDCDEKIKYKKILEAVVNMPKLQEYLENQTILHQDQVVILKNDIIFDTVFLKKFNEPVTFLSKDDILIRKIQAFIEFEQLNIEGDSAEIFFNYEIEGVECRAKYIWVECSWKLIDDRFGEH